MRRSSGSRVSPPVSTTLLENSGLHWTILRPQFLMQNLLDSADAIAEQGAFYLNAGEGRLGMVDARDVAEIAAKILTDEPDHHHAKVYTPTGPEAISFTQVAAQLQQAIGNNVSYVAVPDDAARQAMLDAGLSEWLVGMLEYGQAYSTGWSDYTTNDVQELLERQPRRFADFARDPRRSVHVQAVKRPRTRRCAPEPQRHVRCFARSELRL